MAFFRCPKNCPGREPGCHAYCEDYLEPKREFEKAKAWLRQQEEMSRYTAENIGRTLENKRRRRKGDR